MADDKDKKKKPKKPVDKKKQDKMTMIFFAILVVGFIVITIIYLKKPKSTIYEKKYGDDFAVYVELYSNGNIDIAVDVKDHRTLQSGKYTQKEEGVYTAVFDTEEEDKTEVTLYLDGDTLTMVYTDRTEVVLKEKKK